MCTNVLLHHRWNFLTKQHMNMTGRDAVNWVCTVVIQHQRCPALHQSISVCEWAGLMDGPPGGMKRGGGGGLHVMYFYPLLSLAEALYMESVLFTATHKLIEAGLIRD